jgi:nitrogen-specific signal transduction histidine kinase
MDLKIFDEKILSKEEELKNEDLEDQAASQLFKEGEKAMSLNEIIQKRSVLLEHLIFEIDQSGHQDEEGSSPIEQSTVK